MIYIKRPACRETRQLIQINLLRAPAMHSRACPSAMKTVGILKLKRALAAVAFVVLARRGRPRSIVTDKKRER